MNVLTTSLLITNDGPPLTNATLQVSDDGTVVEISEGKAEGIAADYPVIIPGFVNAHCHLELSHLQGMIREREDGLSGFIRQLLSIRYLASPEERRKAMFRADAAMEMEGITLVGDISNTDESAPVKKHSNIRYHTFIELFGFEKSKIREKIAGAFSLLNTFRAAPCASASLSPHAPYSMIPELYAEIFKSILPDDPLSIHMHESREEFLLCSYKSGPLYETFVSAGIDLSDFMPFGEVSPLRYLLPYFPQENRVQLVHNTYTRVEDMMDAERIHSHLYWCLCPSANLFINGTLPPVHELYRNRVKLTIGTDSLASNAKLSVLNELKIISANFKEVPFETLVQWATFNGAEFLGQESRYGKIKVGMKPGLVGLENVNPEKPEFQESITCKRAG